MNSLLFIRLSQQLTSLSVYYHSHLLSWVCVCVQVRGGRIIPLNDNHSSTRVNERHLTDSCALFQTYLRIYVRADVPDMSHSTLA